MTSPQHALTPMPQDRSDLELRLRAEFVEMPGMKLTLPQASRLFHVDPGECESVLRELVRNGELSSDGTAFARAGFGRGWY